MHTLLHPKLKDCRRLFLHNYEVPVKIGVYDIDPSQRPARRSGRLFVHS